MSRTGTRLLRREWLSRGRGGTRLLRRGRERRLGGGGRLLLRWGCGRHLGRSRRLLLRQGGGGWVWQGRSGLLLLRLRGRWANGGRLLPLPLLPGRCLPA